MTSLSSRADAGTGRASRGMARTHSAILAGLVGPRNHPRLSHTRHQNPGPRSTPPRRARGPTWCGPLPRPTGRASPRTDYLWNWVQVAGCPRVRAARCTCRPRPRQGCCASLHDGPRPPLIREPLPPLGRALPGRPPPAAAASPVHQVQQAGLDARVHPGRDRAGAQYQRAFPSARWMTTACPASVPAAARSPSALPPSPPTRRTVPAAPAPRPPTHPTRPARRPGR